MGLKDRRRELLETKAAVASPHEHAGVQYRVEQMRETLVGDKLNTDALQRMLNARAAEGWVFKQAVEASVKGRVGPGGTSGLLLIFERPAG
jgi:hypothetical protein